LRVVSRIHPAMRSISLGASMSSRCFTTRDGNTLVAASARPGRRGRRA
jgi:hypothetical protein